MVQKHQTGGNWGAKKSKKRGETGRIGRGSFFQAIDLKSKNLHLPHLYPSYPFNLSFFLSVSGLWITFAKAIAPPPSPPLKPATVEAFRKRYPGLDPRACQAALLVVPKKAELVVPKAPTL